MKARECFSLYYEGGLSGAMLDQLELALRQDAQLQAEYNAFKRTMEDLAQLPATPEPEFDLHEHISRRLDQHFFELDRRPTKSLFAGWRAAFAGLVGATALVAAAISIWNFQQGRNAEAGLAPTSIGREAKVPPSLNAMALTLESGDGKWLLKYQVDKAQKIVLDSADAENRRIAELMPNQTLESTLTNNGATVVVIEVSSNHARHPALIALPPKGYVASGTSVKGFGSPSAFLDAVCTFTGKPVVFLQKVELPRLEWTFDAEEGAASVAKTLERFGYAVEEKESGVIWIL